MLDRAILVGGLGFGDEGKGVITQFLAAEAKARLVVRYNGGAQAAHHVIDPKTGEAHCFSQFGSGTFVGASTHLSRFTVLDPLAMVPEAEHLERLGVLSPFDRLTVNVEALIVSPYQRQMNRVRESARGDNRHGSCGLGIGEAVKDAMDHPELAIRFSDLFDIKGTMLWKLRQHRASKLAEAEGLGITLDTEGPETWLDHYGYVASKLYFMSDVDALRRAEGTVIFEGAQGALLHQDRGFYPHTTWSDTSFVNAHALLDGAAFTGPRVRVGVTRVYSTRHGAGPFPTEAALDLTGHEHNSENTWQQSFRVGHLDGVLLRYGLDVIGGVEFLAVTCLDQLSKFEVCLSYSIPAADWVDRWKFFDQECWLRGGPDSNLAFYERLGQILAACKPNLDLLPSASRLLDCLSDNFASVGIVSTGPTLQDQDFLTSRAIAALRAVNI